MKRTFRFIGFVSFLLLFGWASTASAQDFLSGSRPTGMGEAFDSVSTGTSGIYHNPAGLATEYMYLFSGTYEYTPGGNILNASIVDSKTNPMLAAGIGYSYFFGRGEDSGVNGHDVRLALAIPALPDRISIGVEGRWMIINAGDAEIVNGITMNVGVLFELLNDLRLGVTADNLIDVCDQAARCGQISPMTVSGGASYGDPTQFLVSADFGAVLGNRDREETTYEVDAGAEYMAGGVVPIRIGYQHRTAGATNFLTAGLGWRSDGFGLDAGAKLDVEEGDDFQLSTSFDFYF